MTTQEKVENLIKEGIKHPLPAGIIDVVALDKYFRNYTNAVASGLKECFRNYTDTVASTHEELTCEIREQVQGHIQSYYKPLTIVYTKPHTYVTYRGIKIPTKDLYNQSKNKFTAKIVRKVHLRPMGVIPTQELIPDLKDKYCFNIDMIYKMEDQE